MEIITQTFIAVISELYLLTGSLGWSLIVFTILIRTILLPLTLPSLRAANKMKEIQPHIKKLKEKHGKDKKALQAAQLELFKKYNVNPLAGCLPQILQIIVLIVLYQVLINFLHAPAVNGTAIETGFFWMNLALPDTSGILPVLAAGTQLILSLMIAPGGEKEDLVPNNSKSKKVKKENEKEEDFAEMAAKMQQQVIFLMPIMTGVIAFQFPAGLALYWIATTVFSIVQQYYISGLGGLKTYYQRAKIVIQGRFS